AIVFIDTVGVMQSTQSNALCAALIILAFAGLERNREPSAAAAVGLGTAIKIFPAAAAAFALFRPERLARFAAWASGIGLVLLALPLAVITPRELVAQYRSWFALQPTIASLEYSVMDQLRLWFGVRWPYWPVQVLGVAVLLAPFARSIAREDGRYRLRCLASVLMFCVLFNHKAESPTFVIAAAGIGVWFAVSARDRLAGMLLAIVVVGTVLASSEAMPHVIQERFFEPYRLKTLPLLALWLALQWELWRQTTSVVRPVVESARAAPLT
ncbi:MAG: glycosyltransferase 87 family protein, partial [Gemmatimonadaceae bacterium]